MTEDAERLLVEATLATVLGLLLQASAPGAEGSERLLLLGLTPAVLGLAAGRLLPRFLVVGLAIVLVVQAPEANAAELAATSVAAVAAMAIGLGVGVGGSTAAIALVIAPVSVLWIALRYGEPVSVSVLALTGVVTVTGLVALAHDRATSSWSATAGRWWRGLAAVAAVVPIIALATLLVPRVEDDSGASGTSGPAADTRPGDGDASDTFSYPGFGSELDISDPVELGDEIVFRVETDRSTFWRVGTFADFDGERWTADSPPPDVSSLSASLGAARPDLEAPFPSLTYEELTQTFTVERPLAGQIPTAWEPLGVTLWDRILAPRSDGNVSVDRPLTNGETYTVLSALPVVEADDLRRAKGLVPEELRAAYAMTPPTSERVIETALEVTSGATNDFDRIRALEAWIGRQVEYGRDIEPMPEGIDAVDHFLFESRLGFCEQIGTSLVVMARSLGLPARLVVGFVPDERDQRAGEWVVRERNAHAWAEVWFPEVGWQAFDPTSSVPLSAESLVEDDPARDLLTPLLLAIGALLMAGVAALSVRLLTGRRTDDAAASVERVLADRLVGLAERVEVDTTAPRTVRSIAADLADRLDDPELRDVGDTLDGAAFGRRSLGPDERVHAHGVLDRAAATLCAQEEQESIEQPARVRAHSGRRSAKRSRPG